MTDIASGETFVRHYPAINIWDKVDLERYLISLLNSHWPAHPILRQWHDDRGNYPVQLENDDVIECVSELMHTALRKCADSKQSVITWNALHELHDEDRAALWSVVREMLTAAFADGNMPTRRSLALRLREVVVNTLATRGGAQGIDENNRQFEREPGHQFALKMMQAGCDLTEIDEWAYGWLGYIVKEVKRDADVDAAPNAPTQSA